MFRGLPIAIDRAGWALALLVVGCRFDEPPPSKAVYWAAIADVPARPDDHLSRFVRPRSAPSGSHPPRVVERPATLALCAPCGPSVGEALAVVPSLARPNGPILAQPATVRIEVRPKGSWRVCLPVTAEAAGAVTLPAAPFLRLEAKGDYEGLLSLVADLVDAATARTLVLEGAPWLVLESDPSTVDAAERIGAVERIARRP